MTTLWNYKKRWTVPNDNFIYPVGFISPKLESILMATSDFAMLLEHISIVCWSVPYFLASFLTYNSQILILRMNFLIYCLEILRLISKYDPLKLRFFIIINRFLRHYKFFLLISKNNRKLRMFHRRVRVSKWQPEPLSA
jgi:hypothetical protein